MLPGKPYFILVLIAWVAACGGDSSTTGDIPVQIEDSAGVRIVAYVETPTADAPFRFPAEPRYRHGTNPGDYAFRGINVGRLFPDGSAVVSDEWNSELVVLSPDGTTHKVLARRGEGPGEVTYAHAVFALGQDSVLVADPSLGRVTLFAGRSVASPADQRSWLRALSVAGIGSSGGLLLATRVPSERRSEFEGKWLPGHMARFDMETGALDTVASYDYIPRSPTPKETYGCLRTGRAAHKEDRRTPSFPRAGSGWARWRLRPGSGFSMWPAGSSSACSGTKWTWRTLWCMSWWGG